MIATIELKNLLGEVISGDRCKKKLSSLVQNVSKGLDAGGILVIDFKDVKIISPLLILDIAKDIEDRTAKNNINYFKGHFLAVKDPCPDVKKIIEYVLKELRASVYVVYSKNNKCIDHDVLNLPNYLKSTLDIIRQEKSINSAKLSVILDSKEDKGTSARERLRQLYRRGLVRRKAEGTTEGKPHYIYEAFSLIENKHL